jgi:hypothetical protein
MTLNPSIFDFKRKFENVPYNVFIIVHEIGHCIDYIERISFSKKWQAISGWKKCDINDKIPEGYDRYIEKRKGRESAGHKKSDWIYKEGSNFCRRYSSRNPREDFADSFAFAIFKNDGKFKGEGGKEKLIRFGQKGVKGSPKKEGESEAYANRRKRFQTRHAKNIAKGKMSAAWWSSKVKW